MTTNRMKSFMFFSVMVGALILTAVLPIIHPIDVDAQQEEPTSAVLTADGEEAIDAGPPQDVSEGEAPLEEAQESEPQPISPETMTVVGTAFNYQGRLTDNSAPADGAYDLAFAVYTQQSGGSQVGSTVFKNDVQVVDGFFTTELDFGSSMFTGEARYLEIGVRPGNSSGTYNILTPRHGLNPSPYAIHAGNAERLGGQLPSSFASASHTHDSRYYRKLWGTQWTASIAPGETQNWFTHSWPNDELVTWTMYPTTSGGKLEWTLGSERQSNGLITYWIRVVNTGSVTTNFEGRYAKFR